ncbi:MAG TPA: ADOP family duplicated permease, partial [Acidobacteriaceae bacterium]|nr:ADOP family duplicated permease [Acidobacteriaceae bacterium]
LYESRLHDADAPGYNGVAGGIYSEWKKQNHTFARLALVQGSRLGLSGSGGQLPEKLNSAEFSWDLLPTLGVQPALGRNFTQSEDSPSASGTVLLSWQLWKRRFGGDPAILNRTIYIDSVPTTVIGVMPAWFEFPDSSSQLWQPIYNQRPEKMMTSLSMHVLRVVGRLRPGVSETEAIADLSLISRRVHNANLSDPFIFLDANSRPLLDHMVGDVKRPLYILLAATGCVLLIACLNVANLLVARAAARRRDLAIRTALGGGWGRLMRERLMESLLLSIFGGVLGLGFAATALQWLVRTRADVRRMEGVHFDGTVAAFAIGVIVVCALISGLISTFSIRHKNVLGALHESSRTFSGERSRSSLRRALLSIEVCLTVVLLIVAGLLLKSYERLRSSDMGCLTTNVLTMHIGLPDARYPAGPSREHFFDTLLTRIRALPGIEAAGFIDAVPGMGYGNDETFSIVEHPPLAQGKGLFALKRTADPGYFQAIGIPMVRGRVFSSSRRLKDVDELVIDQSFAQTFFPGEEPIGRHIQTGTRKYVIVGVVGSTRFEIGENPRPMFYDSLEAGMLSVGTIVIRSSHDVEQFALPVQQIVYQMDPDLPVSDVLTMDQLLGKATLGASFNTTLLIVFAALALFLAAAGLFGVLSWVTAQRSGEIGIRIALGAQRDEVFQLMLIDGVRPAVLGLVAGLAASLAAARILRGMLYKTAALDPAVFVGVSVLLLLVAIVACMLPAWRASRLDPARALRAE